MATIKTNKQTDKQKTTSVGEHVGKPKPVTIGEHVGWCGCSGKQCGGSSETQSRATRRPSKSTSGHIAKRTESGVSKRYLDTHVHSGVVMHNSSQGEETSASSDGGTRA